MDLVLLFYIAEFNFSYILHVSSGLCTSWLEMLPIFFKPRVYQRVFANKVHLAEVDLNIKHTVSGAGDKQCVAD